METPLSKRLATVATFIPKGSRLLDVGSDHAYLPIALLEQGNIRSAIAGEVVKGPFESAVKNVASSGLSDKIQVRLADGLAAFDESDAIDVITICGMGGRLIADILEAGKAKLATVSRLVLQPNNREDDLRNWLVTNHFQICDETILVENGKYYEIIVAEHGEQALTQQELRFGPILLKDQSSAFMAKWEREYGKLEIALDQIPAANHIDRDSIVKRLTAIKEVINNES